MSTHNHIRTKSDPNKCHNIVRALAHRQLEPNPSNAPYNKAQNHLRSSLGPTFANRIQQSPLAKSAKVYERRHYWHSKTRKRHGTVRTFMFQPAGLSSDSIAAIHPTNTNDYMLFKPKVTSTKNSNEPVVAELDVDYLDNGQFNSRRRTGFEDSLIFVHENAFNDFKFKNAEESPFNNVPMFIVHNACLTGVGMTGPLGSAEFVLHSILFCQYESASGQVRNGKLHFRHLRSTFRKYSDCHLGANVPFEHYYTELVGKQTDEDHEIIFEHDSNSSNQSFDEVHCTCDECELLQEHLDLSAHIGDINIGRRIPIEESLPLRSYNIMHFDLIRTFHCDITKATCSGKAMNRYVQGLESFDIHYREPGYHPYPIPCAALCGYSNGNIRLCTYDRRFAPMRREIKLHDKSIRSVKFNPKNDLQFFVSGDGNFLRLYDLRMFPFEDAILRTVGRKGATPVLDFHEHRSTEFHHQIILDPTTNLLVSAGSDKMVRFWNSSTGKLERCFDPRHDPMDWKNGHSDIHHLYYDAEPAFEAFYSGDFRFDRKITDGDEDKEVQYRSEVLFTMNGEDCQMFTSKIYNFTDSE